MIQFHNMHGILTYDFDAERLPYYPNPFVDANDDYAVLEYYRDRLRFMDKLCMSSYRIGDYARAALKVLEKDDE